MIALGLLFLLFAECSEGIDRMKELSVREMQQRQLAILDYIHDFCLTEGLEYILIGGALLGAVRNGKMIPWDDDIDIFMSRSDYRCFLEKFQDSDRYKLLDSSRVPEYYYPFAKVCDCGTKMSEDVSELGMRPLSCLGVGVDVFPIDDYPENRCAAFFTTLKQRVLQGLCYKDFRYESPTRVSLPTRIALQACKAIMGLKGKHVNEYIRKMDQLWGGVKQGAQVIDTWTYQCYSRDALYPLGTITLEGKSYHAPGNYDKFLTECYGADYMTPRNTQPGGHGVAYEL